jgi:hypothetical protein
MTRRLPNLGGSCRELGRLEQVSLREVWASERLLPSSRTRGRCAPRLLLPAAARSRSSANATGWLRPASGRAEDQGVENELRSGRQVLAAPPRSP